MDFELRDLEAFAGESLLIDEEALVKGALVVEFDWPLADRRVPLRAWFPDSYPRTRPIVNLRGDPATFPKRHCAPINGELCLLGRDTRQWRQKWTLAELLYQQLPDALGDTGDEDQQGEPAEYWWNGFGQPDSYCLVDSSWTLGEATSGKMVLRCAPKLRAGILRMTAYVREVWEQGGRRLFDWQAPLPSELVDAQDIAIPWVFVREALLPEADVAGQLKQLQGKLPFQPRMIDIGHAHSAQVFAILYESELLHRTKGLGWMFPIYWGATRSFHKPKRNQPHVPYSINVLPTLRAGRADLGARVPAVSVLHGKTVAVVGVGAIGAPVATELARAGCRHLHLVDHDTVEPGNAIRWPLGASA